MSTALKTSVLLRTAFISIVLSLMACSGYSITGGPGKTVAQPAKGAVRQPTELMGVSSLLITPVLAGSAGTRLDEADIRILTNSLKTNFHDQLGLEVYSVNADSFAGTSSKLSHEKWRSQASSVGADAYLLTTIDKYTKRQGSSLAAENGAEVSFHIEMFNLKQKQSVWHGSYYFKDQSLSENLLRIGERMREIDQEGRKGWWTAEQLFARGAREVAQKLERDRVSLFSQKASQ